MRHEQLKDFKGNGGYAECSNHLKVTASSSVIWAAAKRKSDTITAEMF